MNVFCPSSLSNSKLPAAAAAKSLWSCSTLCDPRDGSPPGSAIPGILQARTLEWVAIAFSLAMSNLAISVCPAQSMTIQELGSQTHTPWRFFRARILVWVPCPPPGDYPNPGIKPRSPHCRGILYHLSLEGSPIKHSKVKKKMFPVTILTHLVCYSKVGVLSTILG